jgi:predicted DsbA family dithiol-disulfide isomerase
LVIALVILVAGCSTSPTESDGEGKARVVVATVGGQEITREQVEERIRGRLVELDIERYEALKEGLDDLLDETLIESEAKARNVSVDALMDAEVSSKITAPTDADVERFYTENQSQLGGQSLGDLKQSIELYLRQQRNAERRDAFLDGLRDARGVTILLEPPTIAVRAEGPSRGPADAPVTIVEFSDFGCPYCRRAATTLEQVLETYGEKVRLVYRHYPLQPNSQRAAEAASCANESGKFWPYHDLLFANQDAHADADLKRYAKDVGLDEQAFAACLDSGRGTTVVEQDTADGDAAGVTGTPSFFINGRPLSGALPYDALKRAIEEALAKA